MRELDQIKSTITISLGTKNRIRQMKGGQSYEEFINHLIRLRNQTVHNGGNFIEIQNFRRKKGIYTHDEFKILFSYNEYNNSLNFIFDIKLETVRQDGEITSFQKFIASFSSKSDMLTLEYEIYFELLKIAIQNEIEPLFKHNGRFEDRFSWEEEFKILNLPKKSFEEDVTEKLRQYQYSQGVLND